jgi:hypothetical protein
MAVTMKDAVFGDIASCCSRNNRRLVGKYPLHRQGDKNQRARSVSGNY